MLDGFLTTQLLYVAAKLGVADALAAGPRTGDAVAEAVGADPDLLTRVLRGLVLEGVLAEEDGGRFALTAVGEWLRRDLSGSLRGPVVVRGELYYQAAAGLLAAVRHGGTAFEQVYGDRFFDYLARHPEQAAVFQGSMTGRAEQEARDVVAAYDFGGLGRLVDVGGGYGILLGTVLRAAPDLQAVLVDQPAVVERARQRLEADGVAGRCQLVAGDFFGSVRPEPRYLCQGPPAGPRGAAASWPPAGRRCAGEPAAGRGGPPAGTGHRPAGGDPGLGPLGAREREARTAGGRPDRLRVRRVAGPVRRAA